MTWATFAVSTALAVAGAVSNKIASDKVIDRRNTDAEAEAARQRELQKRATAITDETLTKQSPASQAQQTAQIEQQRASAFAPAGTADTGLPSSGSAPIEVKSEIARQIGNAVRKGRAQLTARARLGAFDKSQHGNRLEIGRARTGVQQLQNFSLGSQNALQSEFGSATNAGKGWGNAADLFNLGSSVVGLYGMTKAPTPKPTPRAQGMSGLTINQPGGGLYTYS